MCNYMRITGLPSGVLWKVGRETSISRMITLRHKIPNPNHPPLPPKKKNTETLTTGGILHSQVKGAGSDKRFLRQAWDLSLTSCKNREHAQHMSGCQNNGPFLGTLNIRCRMIIGIQKETIILTTTHMTSGLNLQIFPVSQESHVSPVV